MGFKNQLKKILTGITVPQEYCCLELENLKDRLGVFLTLKDQHFHMDVTASHLFLGYKPLIIGIPIKVGNPEYPILDVQEEICLNLVLDNFQEKDSWKGFHSDGHSIARLTLRRIHESILGDHAVMFYEGLFGEHEFLNSVHQFVNYQKGKWKRRPAGNVGLPGNLMAQVQIAYAIPRIISVITVSDGTLINMFPTDLHGPSGQTHYVSSLRIGGLANDQVEKYKTAVISDVKASSYSQIYELGKNHMKTPCEESRFSHHEQRSHVFDFPLPADVVRYSELAQIGSFDRGIHRIHLYEAVNRKTVQHSESTLAHIHQYYAQWRLDNHLKTTLLLR